MSPITDPYAYLNIVRNPDGTITRDLTKFSYTPPTPNPSPQNAVVSKDLTVNTSKSTYLRLYLPTTALAGKNPPENKLPLIVYYHGGGFVICSYDLTMFHTFLTKLSQDLNAIVISASYRLAPEHRLPAAYEDGIEALHYIKSSDDEWIKSHADFSNVYLMGSSAGGNLAYSVGLRSVNSDLAPLQIRGLILHHPFFGGEERCGSEIRLVDDLTCPPIVSDVFWDLCLPIGVDRDHEYCNPTVGDGSVDLEGFQRLGWRVMVIGGEDDPMVDRQRDLAVVLKKKGVNVVERFTAGDTHGAEIVGDDTKRDALFVSIRDFVFSSSSSPSCNSETVTVSFFQKMKNL